MASVRLTDQLRAEYQRLFDTCVIRPAKVSTIDATIRQIVRNQARYEAVSTDTAIPWHVIALIHALEGSLDFNTHLHNGDSLARRTIQVPRGRPVNGQPPFTWEESATDALEYDSFTSWTDWSLPGTLYKLEGYNGWGYRRYHPEVLSPYLWSFSEHYTRGKYAADGQWSPTLVSRQCGAAVILRRMLELQVASAAEIPAPTLGRASRSVAASEELRRIQLALSSLPNVYVPIDGRMNPETRRWLTEIDALERPATRAGSRPKPARR